MLGYCSGNGLETGLQSRSYEELDAQDPYLLDFADNVATTIRTFLSNLLFPISLIVDGVIFFLLDSLESLKREVVPDANVFYQLSTNIVNGFADRLTNIVLFLSEIISRILIV